MARPQRSRRVCEAPSIDRFTPDPQPRCPDSSQRSSSPQQAASPADCLEPEPVILTVDEYETLRLVDHEGLTHSECARQMNISRTTATEICESARHKVAEAIVCGRELVIEGGSWELCGGNRTDCFLGTCTRSGQCAPQPEKDSR
ncbi:MAG: DUF134 domain-containing protein [Eubacteriales bacterium]|nr:DUF134 domain-containing protein [Eubacteriales bacterium]